MPEILKTMCKVSHDILSLTEGNTPVSELVRNHIRQINIENALARELAKGAKEVEKRFEAEQSKVKEELVASRFNDMKPDWTLLDFDSLLPLVRVMEFGSKKYGAFNWKNKQANKKQSLQSAMRHLIALINDEDIDSESGLAHTGHIMANMMIYEYHNRKAITEQSESK
jgi:hypothetical protein